MASNERKDKMKWQNEYKNNYKCASERIYSPALRFTRFWRRRAATKAEREYQRGRPVTLTARYRVIYLC